LKLLIAGYMMGSFLSWLFRVSWLNVLILRDYGWRSCRCPWWWWHYYVSNNRYTAAFVSLR
jgi:hypothetical protein